MWSFFAVFAFEISHDARVFTLLFVAAAAGCFRIIIGREPSGAESRVSSAWKMVGRPSLGRSRLLLDEKREFLVNWVTF